MFSQLLSVRSIRLEIVSYRTWSLQSNKISGSSEMNAFAAGLGLLGLELNSAQGLKSTECIIKDIFIFQCTKTFRLCLWYKEQIPTRWVLAVIFHVISCWNAKKIVCMMHRSVSRFSILLGDVLSRDITNTMLFCEAEEFVAFHCKILGCVKTYINCQSTMKNINTHIMSLWAS